MSEVNRYQQWPMLYKVRRALWNVTWIVLFRPTPKYIGKRWRNILLRLFGAKVHVDSLILPTVEILEPWNLEVGQRVAIGEHVRLYNHTNIVIEDDVVISQFSELCTSSHDISNPKMPLIYSPILVKRNAWITSGCFVHPGVVVGEGAVIGARSVLTKDAEPWSVYAGNPARKIKTRKRFYE